MGYRRRGGCEIDDLVAWTYALAMRMEKGDGCSLVRQDGKGGETARDEQKRCLMMLSQEEHANVIALRVRPLVPVMDEYR